MSHNICFRDNLSSLQLSPQLYDLLGLHNTVALFETASGASFVSNFKLSERVSLGEILVPTDLREHLLVGEPAQFCQVTDDLEGREVVELVVHLLCPDDSPPFQVLRSLIVSQRYFVNQQVVLLTPDGRRILARVEAPTASAGQLLAVGRRALIRFTGPNVAGLEGLGGQPELLRWYRDTYLLSLRHAALLKDWGIPIPRGLLLFGPPGVGKTLFARGLASSSGLAFFEINAAEVVGPLVGEDARALVELFDKARKAAPAIVFIDEVEALCMARSAVRAGYENRVVTVFLTEMDGLCSHGDVLVIGATNKPELIDPAFLRGGRFEHRIGLELPDRQGRQEILRIHLARLKTELNEIDLASLADRTAGFSGADLKFLAQAAGLEAIRDFVNQPSNARGPVVKPAHMETAFDRVACKPTKENHDEA